MKIGDAPLKEIADGVKLGVPPLVASQAHGITEDEFVEWMRKGQNAGRGDGAYGKFFAAVKDAESVGEATLVGRVRAAASDGNWAAAAWLLERRWPSRYVRKSVRDEQTGPPDAGKADPFSALDQVVPIEQAKSKVG